MGVGISRKSMVVFEGLWVHRLSKPTINFLEMPTPMGESLCDLVRLDVNSIIFIDFAKTLRNY